METLNDYLITCESRYMLGHLTCNGFFASFILVHFVIFVLFYQFEHDLSPFRVKLGSKTFLDFLFHTLGEAVYGSSCLTSWRHRHLPLQ